MTFQASPAVRRSMPVLVALYGPTGCGKTYSALRLAAGLQRVSKKKTYVVDSESGRALHYAPAEGEKADGVNSFDFVHVPFEPPFTSERYIEAMDYCVAQGAGQIIVDSGSHEWEGEGGVLERHYEIALRMAKGNEQRVEAMGMPAWAAVKPPHNRLRSKIARSTVHQIWCFRAKEKNKIGKDPNTGKQTITNIGYMPLGGTDLIFEFMLAGLLLPGSRGVPTWRSNELGEDIVIKVPKQFERIAYDLKGPLSEDVGEALARWGAGGVANGKLAGAQENRPNPEQGPRYIKQYGIAKGLLCESGLEDVTNYIKWLESKTSEFPEGSPAFVVIQNALKTAAEFMAAELAGEGAS